MSVIYKEVAEHPGIWMASDGIAWTEWSQRKPYDTHTPVVRLATRRRMKVTIIDGYHRIVICKWFFVHRLMLEAFVGPCPEGMECRHLDGNKANNAITNLEWGTPKANTTDKFLHGVFRTGNMPGETNPAARLTDEKVLKIRELYSTGERSWSSLAREFSVSKHCIGRVIRRLTWSHVQKAAE